MVRMLLLLGIYNLGAPAQKLQVLMVHGQVVMVDFKFNIKQNVKGLEFIKKLHPVTYQLDTKALDDYEIQSYPDSLKIRHQAGMNFALSTAKVHSGLIAQGVDSAANAVGFTSSIVHRPTNSSDIYRLNYAEIVVPLIQAVQDLSHIVDSMAIHSKTTDSLLTVLQNCCVTGSIQKTMQNNSNEQGNSTNIHNIELANNAVLYQNAPNPFGEGTTIKYFIPDNMDAQIVFYDNYGNQIKIYKVAENGMGQLNVSATNLAAGVYSYSLIVNGKVVDTKKMLKE